MGRIKRLQNPEFLGIRPNFEKLLNISNDVIFQNTLEENIYFISDGEFVKIGVTNNIEKRLESLQSGNPKKLKVIYLIKGNKDLEKYLHSIYSKHKVLNEWFNILQFFNKVEIERHVQNYLKNYNSDFAKVYCSSKLRKKVSGLPSKARSLFLWLVYEIKEKEDFVYIDKNKYMEECDVSLNTLKAAIENLIENSIIKPSNYKDIYWINPLFFFNGSRYEKYKDHVVEK